MTEDSGDREVLNLDDSDVVGRLYSRLVALRNVVNGPMERLAEIGKLNQDRFEHLIKTVALFLHNGNQFKQTFQNRHELDQVFLPPYLREQPISVVQYLFSNNAISAVEVYESIFADPGHIERLTESWRRNLIFARRLEILGPALQAHLKKLYVLSIPVLLAQIDGILQEIFGVRDAGQFKRKLKPFGKRPTDDCELERIAGEQMLPEIINGGIFEQSKRAKGPYPNRHTIFPFRTISTRRGLIATIFCNSAFIISTSALSLPSNE